MWENLWKSKIWLLIFSLSRNSPFHSLEWLKARNFATRIDFFFKWWRINFRKFPFELFPSAIAKVPSDLMIKIDFEVFNFNNRVSNSTKFVLWQSGSMSTNSWKSPQANRSRMPRIIHYWNYPWINISRDTQDSFYLSRDGSWQLFETFELSEKTFSMWRNTQTTPKPLSVCKID